mmetsp:Transcript_10547/g.19133  ORF Transcript_10547/g.19133 Transcript_10547/m.19133 type:complete len:239 (+) Transcript_10547:117-833(+)
MESLYLDVNHFSGTIPTELALIKRLDDLRLRHNNLAGTIPSELGSLEGLQILYLDRNQLTGSVPTEFGHLKYSIELHLYGNQLNGPIPTELANLHALCKYNRQCDDPSLARQRLCFSFELPISALITASLYLDNNKLTGGIPSEFGTIVFLLDDEEQLYVHKNHLNGTLPSEIGKMSNLRNFRAYTNGMKGSIPDDIGGAWKIGESNGLLGLLDNLVCCGFCTQLISCIDTYRKPLPP